jgi:hypothetical protein
VPYVIAVVGGLVLGLFVGRWWALFAAAGLGVRIAVETGVDEVPPWFLGVVYATLAACAIAVGVVVRKRKRFRRYP